MQGFRANNIVKKFAGVKALSGVSFSLRPGEVVGLVGHNGAGKSTLLKILSGAHQFSSGTLELDGQDISFGSPSDAINKGVSTVYQELSLMPNLSVNENIWLGREISTFRGLNKTEMRHRAEEILAEFALELDLDAKLGSYPVATRQLLEIAIAATKNTKYLLLDEPTTSLEGEQVTRLLSYVKELVVKRNVGVLLVDHKLDELYQVADRIVALVDGKVIIDADVHQISQNDVIHAIIGDELNQGSIHVNKPAAQSVERSKEVLKVASLSGSKLTNISMMAHEGEVVGLYGLVGSGRTEFLRSLMGLEALAASDITVFGSAYQPKDPRTAMRRGFAYLSEERKTDGIIPKMNSYQNISIAVLDKFARFGVLNRKALRRLSVQQADDLKVKGNRLGPIVALSGGNQQKVLLARVLAQKPKILLLDEPTKGVDIGVKTEIHQLLREMAVNDGLTLIVVSSEEEEILEVSDTIYVFAGGRIVSDAIDASQLSVAKLRKLAWSGQDQALRFGQI